MNITFIGGGNMAGAIIGGLLSKGYAAGSLRVVEIAPAARQRLEQQFGVQTYAAVSTAAVDSDCIVLAVKPQQLREAAIALKPLLGRQLVISIAAGIRATDLSRWLGGYQKLARAMPNTPALVSAGCTGIYALPGVGSADRSRVDTVLGAVGTTLWLEREEQLDAVTAVSGSGPAYVFYFIEALQQAAQELGFSPAAARELALGTFSGAVELATGANEDVATLRLRVTSKGGTTERAIAHLDANQVRECIVAAVHAAAQRSRELGTEFGKD